MFKQRLPNIANAKLPTNHTKINIPCLYLQASHDSWVKSHNIQPFRQYFTNFQTQQIHGTHFLLQTNSIDCWQAIKRFMQQTNIN